MTAPTMRLEEEGTVVRHGVLALALLAALGGAWAGCRGVRLLARGLRCGDDLRGPLWVIRGLRGIIVWVCLTSLGIGVVLEQVWLLVFAGLWLAEEIYETGVLALILRAGDRDPAPHLPLPAGRAGCDGAETSPSPLGGEGRVRGLSGHHASDAVV
ncbi:MAG: hypothetical protein L0027_18075 [Candidatus Rokubacteria bacterium]|nr:hypothetical protein [Candidatus Rokubacteria bacterium]